MVKRHVPLEAGEMLCPACGATIKGASPSQRRRVQCPKCREVIQIEGNPGKELTESARPMAPAPAGEEVRRIEALEARVEALEAALRTSPPAERVPASPASERKMHWVASTSGEAPGFSPEQGDALLHNLGGIRSQAIAIRTPAGDADARTQAEWFQSIFERAGWTVYGPEEITPTVTIADLSLAVAELPVGKEAAATYLALKAAGLEPIPVLDSTLGADPGKAAMALTVPPGKVA